MKRLLVAACAAGAVAGCGEDRTRGGTLPEWATGPSIEVIGRAYIEVPPNRASFSVSFHETSTSSAEASATVVERAQTAAEAIRAVAPDAVLIRADLDVYPYYEQVTVKVGEFEEEIIENEHPDALLGYTAAADLDVTVLDPSFAAVARGAALSTAPTYSYPINFYLEPSADQQRDAYRAAVQDAEARARATAAATGRSLGRTLLVQEGNAQCLGYLSSRLGRAESLVTRADEDREKITVTGSRIRRGLSVEEILQQSVGADGSQVDLSVNVEEIVKFAISADPEPQRVTATVCAVYAVR